MQFNLAFVTSLLVATSVLSSPLEERQIQTIPVTIYDQTSGRGGFTTLNLQAGTCSKIH